MQLVKNGNILPASVYVIWPFVINILFSNDFHYGILIFPFMYVTWLS